jgi:hypothetical protein
LTKHLQTSHAVWNDIDLISFRGEKPLQNLLQSPIVLDNQDPIHGGWFGSWNVQRCCQGDACHKLFLFQQDRRFDSHLTYPSVASSNISSLCVYGRRTRVKHAAARAMRISLH